MNARRGLSLALAILAGYALRDAELRFGWLPPLLLALVTAVAWLAGCVWQGHRLTNALDRMRAERDQALAGRLIAIDHKTVVPLPLTDQQRAKKTHPAGRGR